MTRQQKQTAIAVAAQNLANEILGSERDDGTYDRKSVFFGNQGVTVYRDGKVGDIVGYVLHQAGVLPRVVLDETDPAAAVALSLGVTKGVLPEELQVVINTLAITADDTKRSYARRVPKLVSLLENFAEKIENVDLRNTGFLSLTAKKFEVPGKTL